MSRAGSTSGDEPPLGSAAQDASQAASDDASPPPAGKPSASARVVKNSFWLIAQPLLMNAISLFQVAYVARHLGKIGYGRFVFAIAFTAMFTPVTNLGLRLLTVRHIATSDRKDVATYVGRMTTLRFLLSLLGAGLSLLIVSFIHQTPETKEIVHLASAIIVLQALTSTMTDVFQGFENMRLDAQVRFTAGMVNTVASVVAVFLGYGVVGVMATYVLGNLVGTVLAAYYLFSRFTVPKLAIDFAFWKENLVKAVPFFFPTLINQAGSRIGIVILAAMVGEAAVGTYGAASSLVEKLIVIPDGVCSALFPTLAAVYTSSRPEAGALYRRFFGYFFIIGLPIAIGTGIVSGSIITLIYGQNYQGSPLVLALLIWGLFMNLFTSLQGWSAGAIHQERRVFFIPIIATAIHLVFAVVLIKLFQEKGLAIAGIVLGVVSFLLYNVVIRATLSPRSLQPGLFWKVLLANGVMAAVTYPLRSLPVVVPIAAAAVSYGALAVGLRIVSREELAAVTKLVRKRMRRSRPAPPADATPTAAG